MSLPDAGRATAEFLKVIEEAQDMVTAGALGSVLDELLRHARELLDILDEELSDVNHEENPELFAAAPILRQKLERLRDELRGDTAH